MDINDKRNNGYGEWYSDSNPLTIQKIKSSMGCVQKDQLFEHTA